jgi:tetratricopeptide (TPR) repeat protein
MPWPAYERALKLVSTNGEAWLNRGLALMKAERYAEAVTSYDRAIQLKPQNSLAWFNRGIASAKLHKYAEAVTAYDRVLQMQPNDCEAWFYKGMALNTSGPMQQLLVSIRQLKLILFMPKHGSGAVKHCQNREILKGRSLLLTKPFKLIRISPKLGWVEASPWQDWNATKRLLSLTAMPYKLKVIF